jgi:hypothetical protein
MRGETERQRVRELLTKHPGWTDGRIARESGLPKSTVRAWRHEWQLAPAARRVYIGGRREGLRLSCGHLVAPPPRFDEHAWPPTIIRCHACNVERPPMVVHDPERGRRYFRAPDGSITRRAR